MFHFVLSNMDKIEKPNFSFIEIKKPFAVNEIRKLLKILKTVKNFNKCMHNGIFPKIFKLSEVIPVHKKDEPYNKSNYQPVSIFSNLSKIYERYKHDDINAYFDDILSNFQRGFCKDYSAQHCLLYMIEKISFCDCFYGSF